MNLNNISKIISNMKQEISKSKLEDIEKKINDQANFILKNLPITDTIITFNLNFKSDSLEAYVVKIDNNFTITLNHGLILYLIHYSNDIVNNKNYFTSMYDKHKLKWSLFYFWIEIIILHEFVHIYNKHFQFLQSNIFFEFSPNVYSHDINNLTKKHIELDADRLSGKIFMGLYYSCMDIFQDIFPNLSKEQLLEKMLIEMVLYLFDILYILDKDKRRKVLLKKIKNISWHTVNPYHLTFKDYNYQFREYDNIWNYSTHPHPFIRGTAVLSGANEIVHDKPDFFTNVSLKFFEELTTTKYQQFIFKHYDRKNNLNIFIEGKELYDSYINIFISKKLKQDKK